MELSEQGRKLLAVLVAEIAKGKLNPDKPEGFLGLNGFVEVQKRRRRATLGWRLQRKPVIYSYEHSDL